jgi:hypothetical protein
MLTLSTQGANDGHIKSGKDSAQQNGLANNKNSVESPNDD